MVGLAVAAALGLRGLEPSDPAAKATKPCGALDQPQGSPSLPPGFALPTGQKLLKVDRIAKTSVVYASTAGSRDDLVRIRDEVSSRLEGAGYRRTGSDQEPGFEADATLQRGDVEDTVNVRPLCDGRVVIRYTLH